MKMRLTRAQSSEPEPAGHAAPANPGMSSRDVADYIADMTLQLSRLARSAGLTNVMVPLEFAYYEAFAAANKVEIPPEELRYLKSLEEACRSFTGTPDDSDTPT
jgi:hypothetical protein